VSQDVVIKETAVMAGMRHPNVLPLLAAFVEGGSLWMVLPFYASGSLLSIVQYRHPEVDFATYPVSFDIKTSGSVRVCQHA